MAESHGRYQVHEAFARGGMASVHFGELRGAGGFTRVVAIKRLYRELAAQQDIAVMLADEARLSARISHANVVAMLDVVEGDGELLLVTEYVDGEPLAALAEAARSGGERVPLPVAVAVLSDALRGLHAAHNATLPGGASLGIVHRDVNPANILVGADGVSRVLDFGVATARTRAQRTRTGQIKGKLHYLSPEQVHGDATPRSDVFAAGAVAWELVTGERLFSGKDDGALLAAVLAAPIPRPSARGASVPEALDDAIMRSLARGAQDRFPTAQAMALALEQAVSPATPSEIAAWVERWAGPELHARRARVLALEQSGGDARARGLASSGRGAASSHPPRLRLLAAGAAITAAVLASAFAARRFAFGTKVVADALVAPSEQGANLGPLVAPSAPAPAQTDERAPRHAPAPRSFSSPAPAARGRSAHTAQVRAACDPPFVFDDQGRKHFKEDCF
jgi:hypothetical protein